MQVKEQTGDEDKKEYAADKQNTSRKISKMKRKGNV